MIPSDTKRVLGTQQPVFAFDPDGYFALDGYKLNEIEALMRRLGTEQRMTADEMRDWMNLLYSMLASAVDVSRAGQ